MNRNRLIVVIHDILMIPIAWFGSYWLRFNLETIPPEFLKQGLSFLPILLIAQIAAYQNFGLYRGLWRFASLHDLLRIVKAVFVGTAFSALIIFLFTRMEFIPRSFFPLYAVLLISFLGGSRLTFRWIKDRSSLFNNAENVLIVGSVRAGEAIIRELLRDPLQRYKPVAFIDEEAKKTGEEIHGVRIEGSLNQISPISKRYNVTLIIIALPEASGEKISSIIELCEQNELPFRILPTLVDIAAGDISINQLREVSVEDLLGRAPVTLQWDKIHDELTNQCIFISGGGGSIGSELCRQIARLKPNKLIIIESNEFNLYSIDQDLRQHFPEVNLYCYLGDVLDKQALNSIMQEHKPDIVFHAAAYKHVPLLETQVRIAIRNNIFGTHCVADAAIENGVKKFVLISTDKAVNPTNVMGATKRVAEILCQNFNQLGKTRFITVRFGNVLDSAGSVVPLFRKQLEAGGPLTVTHPEVTRFFMTIPEASLLILQAAAMGKGGEIFVLDMGKSIKIIFLAEQMIRLSGKKAMKDIQILFTGLRPGEKLYEELFYDNEALMPTNHEKIMQAKAKDWDWTILQNFFTELESSLDQNPNFAKSLLTQIVNTYHS
ncbi:MAG: UDP-N-acetyl-alpha-D-glucosamine C6 dehydratase [Legionellaceae bacterium]